MIEERSRWSQSIKGKLFQNTEEVKAMNMRSKGILKWQKALQEVEKSYLINLEGLENTKRFLK